MVDVNGDSEVGFNDAVLFAGRSCRDPLDRACASHQQHDAALICDPKPIVHEADDMGGMKM